ncbi:uncharacterized protein SAMN06269117_10385 [Balnearium lithotrophicum]|uniref:DUF177 domain-containing protein n=1 Tax=Balnearium lithotrophicum TaxID=223788 RepID=A0A521B2I5_9BACT|nr:uncharacterized protein SAMN06269117_10385 [Balnearium lithotrophicum]
MLEIFPNPIEGEEVKRKVNLSEITAKEPLKVKTTIQPSIMNLPKEEVSSSSPFELEVEITKKAVGYQFKGKISGEVELTCSRCLKKYKQRIENEFDYKMLPTSEIGGGEIKGSDLDVKFSDESVVDLAEVTEEQILLNLPVKPLCSEECEGVNYMEEKEEAEESWKSKLKELKNKLKDKE